MPRTPKPLDQAKSNFEAAIPGIRAKYEAGIDRARWAEFAASDQAEANFNAAMTEVLTRKLRAAGIRRVGDTKWKTGAIEKGGPVIGARISAALNLWETNFGKVYAAVLRLLPTLKPRTLDPMANIDNRVKPVVRTQIENRVRRR